MDVSRDRLSEILAQRFGHAAFRPYQAEVCEAAARGEDVLLVMPTGAGKSLCYQIPGVARGGTTLVVSPLIALMEDQAQKLLAQGLRAARIHSGIPRESARASCRAYLDGTLDFLFIAPERLRVPGFPEMLAKRLPALVAVDEAHCISQWGHDFRPDYRMLKDHVAKLRPSPVIALTATATPAVQDDIARELGMSGESRFVRGFRRENIAVEIAERPQKDRIGTVISVLSSPERRPAIVYAATRKMAEEVAAALPKECRAAPYHAGMVAAERDRVQRGFLAGTIDVVVATIAFGMGVDKADVRTVVHLALPGSVEGYYQEIGRAGRDGKPSRALLMYSYQDIKTHEFFFDRDYPETSVLHDVMEAAARGGETRDSLGQKLNLAGDVLEKAVEKLWLLGAAFEDADGAVATTNTEWRPKYDALRDSRWSHVTKMQRLAEASSCRMAALVHHFGDRDDALNACRVCDACDPSACMVHVFRAGNPAEERAAEEIRQALRQSNGLTLGQLHRGLVGEAALTDRKSFDRVIRSMVRSGELHLREDKFAKDGKEITFFRAQLIEGRAKEPLYISDDATSGSGEKKKRDRVSRSKAKERAQELSQDAPVELVEALRSFRKREAARTKVPAFRVLTDRVLYGIATRGPKTLDELETISGVGPSIAKKYGEELLALVASTS